MNDEAARIARSEQARAAWDSFAGPAFAVARADYLEKLGEVAAKPLTADMRAGMEKLALAVKVLDEVRAQIKALIADGEVASAAAKRQSRMMDLPAEKRKWAQF